MIAFPDKQRIFVYQESCDMRIGIDGLSNLTKYELNQDPCSGDLFVFINSKRNRLKILVWERGGFWLLSKRLETGRFPQIQNHNKDLIVTRTDFMMMIDGIVFVKTKQTKRFMLPKKE
jgi:transposase